MHEELRGPKSLIDDQISTNNENNYKRQVYLLNVVKKTLKCLQKGIQKIAPCTLIPKIFPALCSGRPLAQVAAIIAISRLISQPGTDRYMAHTALQTVETTFHSDIHLIEGI